MLFETYRRSLKMPEAEEFFDLIFYRPAAYLVVLGFARTPITPNQITILSLIAGCVAACELFIGTSASLIAAALWYIAANILDCADGQLARIKKNGTPMGRVVDGVADYISSVAIFLGIGFGLSAHGNAQWWLVVVAGISSALHAIKFDEVQGKFISTMKGEEDFTAREIETYTLQLSQLEGVKKRGLRYGALKLYLSYLSIQQRIRAGQPPIADKAKFHKANYSIIRYWTLLGPTTNRTLLILSAFLGNVEMFLWIVVVPGNLWLLFCSILQQRINKRQNSNPDLQNIKPEA